MEISLLKVLSFFLNDRCDVIGDDDYLTVSKLFHELCLDKLYEFTVLDL